MFFKNTLFFLSFSIATCSCSCGYTISVSSQTFWRKRIRIFFFLDFLSSVKNCFFLKGQYYFLAIFSSWSLSRILWFVLDVCWCLDLSSLLWRTELINISHRCELFLSIFPPIDLSPEWEGLVYLAGFNLGNKSDEQAGNTKIRIILLLGASTHTSNLDSIHI